MKQYIIIPDIHVPFHDSKYTAFISRLLSFIKSQGKLKGIVQLGDFVDFFQISSYPKDPARRNSIKDDLDDYTTLMNEWATYLPRNGEYHQLEGNHEARLQKYISNNAKEIYELVESVKSYLTTRFKSSGSKFCWHTYKKWNSLVIGDVTLLHGFYYNQHTAATNLNKYKTSVICGHTHRFQIIHDGVHYSCTLGHGSDEKETAHQPTPTGWQQCCAVLTLFDNGKTNLEPIMVNQGRGFYGGKLI
jgi:predicted phosphodiesterase